ncbi:iron-siderophore ABC transporter substrate-binding protein [Leucobacter weissii]|uniref:Iron-siderophore ABC transporter substrate-binding protein n=1 Tax=Leucobacter weissii TaxID=1983706 RepID=A0A939MJ81_9MICO|nr:iron-siderophore ABC transporter substrate-binding protein [Leucobacter weissii]MBO1901561.1 iron-siderophore ABC transporter substrate-binding protein [Leucobacter weissii]
MRTAVRARALTTVLLTAALALSASGCSNDEGAEPGDDAGSAYGVAVGEEGIASGVPGIDDGTPIRVIADVNHEPVAVPSDPQRVVTLSEPTLDGALRLGVTPVGSVNGRGQSTMPNYLLDLAEGIPSVGSVAQFNFEAIAELQPDLILTYASGGNNPESVAILERIAPVYFVGYAGADWRTTFENVANALGEADAGAEVLEEFDAYAADVRGRLASAGYADKTYSIVRWQGSNASLILKDLPPGMALEALGLQRPPAQDREGRGHSEPISLENLADADADVMFFGTLGGSSVGNPDAGGSADLSGARQALREAEQVPGFRELEAYRNGEVILVDGSLWTSTGGPVLMTRIIEFIEQELLSD